MKKILLILNILLQFSIVNGQEKLPDWFFNIPQSDDNYLYTIGVSDPNTNYDTAFYVAQNRSLIFATILYNISFDGSLLSFIGKNKDYEKSIKTPNRSIKMPFDFKYYEVINKTYTKNKEVIILAKIHLSKLEQNKIKDTVKISINFESNDIVKKSKCSNLFKSDIKLKFQSIYSQYSYEKNNDEITWESIDYYIYKEKRVTTNKYSGSNKLLNYSDYYLINNDLPSIYSLTQATDLNNGIWFSLYNSLINNILLAHHLHYINLLSVRHNDETLPLSTPDIEINDGRYFKFGFLSSFSFVLNKIAINNNNLLFNIELNDLINKEKQLSEIKSFLKMYDLENFKQKQIELDGFKPIGFLAQQYAINLISFLEYSKNFGSDNEYIVVEGHGYSQDLNAACQFSISDALCNFHDTIDAKCIKIKSELNKTYNESVMDLLTGSFNLTIYSKTNTIYSSDFHLLFYKKIKSTYFVSSYYIKKLSKFYNVLLENLEKSLVNYQLKKQLLIDFNKIITTSPKNIKISPSNVVQYNFQSDVASIIPQNTNTSNIKTFALIIGNENYSKEIKVKFALNDARVFKLYMHKTFGIDSNNIHYIENATYGQILDALTWINDVTKAYNGQAKIIFYYAGHGMPDEKTKSAYLLPVDGNSQNPLTAIKLSDVYEKLTEFPSISVTVFLDACFSGSARETTPTMLAQGRGIKIKPKPDLLNGNIAVFSAATNDETAFPYNEKQHGMFTYFLLKKIQSTKGDVTLSDLSSYIITNVSQQSIVVNKKAQTPQINTSSQIQNSWQTIKLK